MLSAGGSLSTACYQDTSGKGSELTETAWLVSAGLEMRWKSKNSVGGRRALNRVSYRQIIITMPRLKHQQPDHTHPERLEGVCNSHEGLHCLLVIELVVLFVVVVVVVVV